jgi:hypothetical protein
MENFKVKPADKKRYLLPDKKDLEILQKIYSVEAEKLSAQDRELVKLIRTQLLREWRPPLIKTLDKLLDKYK